MSKPTSGSKVAGLMVQEEILTRTLAVPAVYSNRFYAMPTESGLRITFCESLGPDATVTMRSAVMLSPSDAKALRDLLTEQLQHYQQISAGSSMRN